MRWLIVCRIILGLLVIESKISFSQAEGEFVLESFKDHNPIGFEITADNRLEFKNYPQSFVGSLYIKLLSSPLFKILNRESCEKIETLLKNRNLSEKFRDAIKEDFTKKTKARLSLENYPLLNKELIFSELQKLEIPSNEEFDTIPFLSYPFSKLKIHAQISTGKHEEKHKNETVEFADKPFTSFSLSFPILIHTPFIVISVINGEQACSLISKKNELSTEFIFSNSEENIILKSNAKLSFAEPK